MFTTKTVFLNDLKTFTYSIKNYTTLQYLCPKGMFKMTWEKKGALQYAPWWMKRIRLLTLQKRQYSLFDSSFFFFLYVV